jgi:hypothetical protein
MIKYQGIVEDRLNREYVKKTRYYTSYRDASNAASKLSKKYFLEGRANINVESIINENDRFYKSIAKMI